MKTLICIIVITVFCSTTLAADLFVNAANSSPAHPYNSWATAATDIQTAVDAASNGDNVIVTNGIYDTGGRPIPGNDLTNRVYIAKDIIVKSVNGPVDTIIVGNGPLGNSAVRCVFISSVAPPVLSGFTLSNGYTEINAPGEFFGGGVDGSSYSIISNCIIRQCVARDYGGGGSWCSFYNCTFIGNTAGKEGGGVYNPHILKDSVVYGNYADNLGGGIYIDDGKLVEQTIIRGNSVSNFGGGVYMNGGTIDRCEIFENASGTKLVDFGNGGGVYCYRGKINNCLIINNSAAPFSGSSGNGGGVYLDNANAVIKNCTIKDNTADFNGHDAYYNNGGTNYNSIIGNRHENSGAPYFRYCCLNSSASGVGNITGNPEFIDSSAGDYRLKSSSPCINTGYDSYAAQPYDIKHTARIVNNDVDMGCYEFVPEYAPSSPNHYVSLEGNNSYPYNSPLLSAHTIQDAIEAAKSGDTIHVAEGFYPYGYQIVRGMKNRVAANKPVYIIAEESNPAKTIISGTPDYLTQTVGSNAFRCVYLTNGAELAGFTLQNGYTKNFGNLTYEQSGGGTFLDSGGVISNCIITGNVAEKNAGGAYCYLDGKIVKSKLTHNYSGSYGGGIRCAFGGMVDLCEISNNKCAERGGGIDMFGSKCYVRNCLITYNTSESKGGGIYRDGKGVFENCTITANSASYRGGGVYLKNGGTNINSIIYYNSAPDGFNNWYHDSSGGHYLHCCTIPLLAGCTFVYELTNKPDFVSMSGEDFHLMGISPCINTGTNFPWMTSAKDLDGDPRIYEGTVDMGCYEFIPEPGGVLLFGIFILFFGKIKLKL